LSEGTTVKYSCRYSDTYNTAKAAWFAMYLTDPKAALALLDSPDAATELERIRLAQKEERAEARKAEKKAGQPEGVEIPADAAAEVVELCNAADSLKRAALLFTANTPAFSVHLTPYAERVRELVKAMSEEAKAMAEEAKAA
jgi:hypothetical protein